MSKISPRRIVIGDIHGHYDGLMSLLEAIAPGSDDMVYFLGDLIDRGPQSAQVVNFVMQSPYHCLLGNHEQMLVDILVDGEAYGPALQSWLYGGGQNTLNSYGDRGIPQEHLDWIQTLPTYIDLGDIWLVHAGIDPRLPLEQQTSDQFCWVREEFHRWPKPFFPDKLIVTGHTITFTLPGVIPGKLAKGNGWLDIDTGAYHPRSGWLTALDITNWLVYQVNIWQKQTRQMPLAAAVTRVEPTQFFMRHDRC